MQLHNLRFMLSGINGLYCLSFTLSAQPPVIYINPESSGTVTIRCLELCSLVLLNPKLR